MSWSAKTPFTLADDDEDAEDDAAQPILNAPDFRFGQSLPADSPPPPPRRPKVRASSRAKPPLSPASTTAASNSAKSSVTSLLPVHGAPPPTPASSTEGRRSFTTPALVIIVAAVLVLVVTDASTGILSKALSNTFGSSGALPPPQPGIPIASPTASATVTEATPDVQARQPSPPPLAPEPPDEDDGTPPKSLPADDPNAALLNALRGYSEISPRWPPRAGTDVGRLRSYGPAYASIVVSHMLKLVYVPVFKVATTSTMYMIAYLENNRIILDAVAAQDGSHMQLLHDMGSEAWENHTIYNLTPEEIGNILDDPAYLKFGFVRNPFDRLVSAYVDKVARPAVDSYEYQQQLHSLFGDSGKRRERFETKKPSFDVFVNAAQAVLSMPRVFSDDLGVSDAYENNTSRRDLHWRAQNELLHTDLIPIDFVGRYDRMAEDREKLLQWIYRHTNRRMPKEEKKRLHTSDPKLKVELLQRLSDDEQLRNKVRMMYKDDFQRFHFPEAVPTSCGEIM